jgi:hypothetical protein
MPTAEEKVFWSSVLPTSLMKQDINIAKEAERDEAT